MVKRGVSPLIATILLVGAVFAIGLMLMSFYRDTVTDTTQDTDEKIDATNFCLYGVDLEFEQPCQSGTGLSIKIKNNKNGDISGFNFFVVNSDGTSSDSVKNGVNDVMNGISSKRYTFGNSINVDIIDKIIITPIMETELGIGECPAKELIIQGDINICCFDMDSDGYDTCDLGVPDQLDNNVADCDDDDESIYKLSSIYYPDNDLDTYFAKFTSEVCCGVSVPDGWQSFAGGDCDDDNPNINPTKPDICGNNIDENCDGTYALCPACVIDAEVLPSGCDCLNVPCYQGYCCSDGCSNQDCFYIGP